MTSSPSRFFVLCVLAMPFIAGLPGCSPADGATASAPAVADGVYVAMARGRVDVPGGLLRVTSPQPGLIQSWSVAQGESVRKGQLLAQIDAREARLALEQARAEQAHASAQLDALRARLPALKTKAQRLLQAQQAGAGSGQAADDAQAALIEAQTQEAVQRSALNIAKQRVSQATQTLAAAAIRAPVAGRVVKRMAEVGEFVDARAVLLQLLPDGPRIVRADLNEALVARVRSDMRAEVVSVAEGSSVHGARVLSIGDVFGPPGAADPSGGETIVDARVVECLLQLDEPDLRVGQRVLVKFLPAVAKPSDASASAPATLNRGG
jgi:multidrug efflux pump subunit AcrA (membrane-fusion protein)